MFCLIIDCKNKLARTSYSHILSVYKRFPASAWFSCKVHNLSIVVLLACFLRRAQSCKLQWYCSAACQKKAWKTHKAKCTPARLSTLESQSKRIGHSNPVKWWHQNEYIELASSKQYRGFGVRSRQSIKAGTLLFSEVVYVC